MKTKLILLALVTAVSVSAQDFHAGVARVDITPAGPIRLAGYAGRNKPSESVDQHLFVKALALKDSAGATTLILPPTPSARRAGSTTNSPSALNAN